MTSKRTKADGVSAAPARRPRRGGAMHSPTPLAPSASPIKSESTGKEAVALLAYSYWESRGYAGGSPEEDWLRAEQELGLGS